MSTAHREYRGPSPSDLRPLYQELEISDFGIIRRNELKLSTFAALSVFFVLPMPV
jgi:hypothetical protein